MPNSQIKHQCFRIHKSRFIIRLYMPQIHDDHFSIRRKKGCSERPPGPPFQALLSGLTLVVRGLRDPSFFCDEGGRPAPVDRPLPGISLGMLFVSQVLHKPGLSTGA